MIESVFGNAAHQAICSLAGFMASASRHPHLPLAEGELGPLQPKGQEVVFRNPPQICSSRRGVGSRGQCAALSQASEVGRVPGRSPIGLVKSGTLASTATRAGSQGSLRGCRTGAACLGSDGSKRCARLAAAAAVEEHKGELARERNLRLARTGSLRDRARPVAQPRSPDVAGHQRVRHACRCGRSGWSRRSRSASAPGRDRRRRQVLEAQVDAIAAATGEAIVADTADAGYACGEIYGELERRGIEALIPAEAEPIRSPLPLRRFRHDARHDFVKCPRGRTLCPQRPLKHGRFFYARARDCALPDAPALSVIGLGQQGDRDRR